MSYTRAYLGFGSNKGDRLGFVQQAMQMLKDMEGVEVVECSSLYEAQPLSLTGIPDNLSTWFVNAVVAIDTTYDAKTLLTKLEEIEERLSVMAGLPYDDSRSKRQKAVDLDILFYGDQVINTSKLHIPHKNIYKRAYALVPMLEIAPDLVHPAFNKTVLQLHEALVEPEEVYLYGTRDHELDFE